MQLKVRDPYLDTMKGWGILLVILGHLIPRGALWNTIYGFHMPMFVFCSGLVEKKGLNWKRLMKLMGCYLTMALVACGLYFFTHEYGNIYYIKQTIYNVAVGGYSPGHGIYPIEALWYLPCLSIMIVLYHVLDKITNTWIRFTVSAVLACFGIALSGIRDSVPMIFNLDVCLVLLPFFVIAPWCKHGMGKIQKIRSVYLAVLVCALTAVYYLAVQWNGEINLYRGVIGRSRAVFYLGAYLGIGDLLCISVLVCRFLQKLSVILRLLGTHTLVMMGSHQLFILYFREFLPGNVHPAILFVCVTASAFTASVVLRKLNSVLAERRINRD
jgi:fucose 4-O-acetylase-like acetyltransferase